MDAVFSVLGKRSLPVCCFFFSVVLLTLAAHPTGKILFICLSYIPQLTQCSDPACISEGNFVRESGCLPGCHTRVRNGPHTWNCSSVPSWNPLSVYTCGSPQSLSGVQRFATPWTVSPTRLLCPWDSSGRDTGVDCRFLLLLCELVTNKTVVYINRALVWSEVV